MSVGVWPRRVLAVVVGLLLVTAAVMGPVAIVTEDEQPIGQARAASLGDYFISSDDSGRINASGATTGDFHWGDTNPDGNSFTDVSIGPDATYAYTIDNADLRQYRVDDGTLERNIDITTGVSEVKAGADGTYFFVGLDETTNPVDAYYVSNGTKAWSASEPGDRVAAIAISPDGETIYAGSQDNNIYALHSSNGTHKWTYTQFGSLVGSLGVSPDGEVLYAETGGTFKAIYTSNQSDKWDKSETVRGDVLTDSDGHLYYANANDVVKSTEPDGTTIRYSKQQGATIVDGAYDPVNDIHYQATYAGTVLALDGSDGSLVFNKTIHPGALTGEVSAGSNFVTTSGLPGSGESVSGTVETQYRQTFELYSFDTERFPPQSTTLSAYYYENQGTGGPIESPENKVRTLEDSDDDGFGSLDNQSTLKLENDTMYHLRLEGPHGDQRDVHGFHARKSRGDDVINLFAWGPNGSVNVPDQNETDIPLPPADNIPDPIDLPENEIPPPPGVNDSAPGPYLDTGKFWFDGEPCVGLRYNDPSGETEELAYNFTYNETHYADTILFDEPVGYYETCISPLNTTLGDIPEGEGDLSFNLTRNGTEWNGSLGFGDPIGGGGLGGALGPVSGGGGGGGGGDTLWILALLGAAGGAYYYRQDLRRLGRQAARRIGLGGG